MRSLLALLFVCTLAGAGAPAQSPPPEAAEAERLNAEVVALYNAGKFAEALAPAQRLLEIRRKAFGDESLAAAYATANLATLHVELKHDGEAERLFKAALAAAEKLGAPARPLLADISHKLAGIRYRDRDYQEAERHLLRALELRVAVKGPDDLSAVPVLLNLTDLNYQRQRSDEAEAYLMRAVGILLKHPPHRDPPTWETLRRYVCLLTEESREGELSESLARALYRLEEPEKAAERERKEKERQERGEAEVQAGVLNGRAIQKVAPSYPPEARERRIMGKVVVRITVNEQGRVTRAERFCGNPILSDAAVEAVRKWRFTPTTLDGAAVKVTGTVTVNFTLRP